MDIHAKLKKLCSGKYLKPVDCDELPEVVTIRDVNEELMPSQEMKFVMHFREYEKGIVLKDNHLIALSDMFGEDMSLYETVGKKIQIFETTSTYKGTRYPVLGFEKQPSPKKYVPAELAAKAAEIKQANEEADDKIPF